MFSVNKSLQDRSTQDITTRSLSIRKTIHNFLMDEHYIIYILD